MTEKKLLSHIRKAVDDFSLIENNDKIAVGISGGKDSLALLIGLNNLKNFYPKKFQIEAITISLGLENFDLSQVASLCKKLDIPYTVVETKIGEIVFDIRKEKNPCSLCSKMRKGAIVESAKKLNCNKIAYGHNRDDVIETLFMSMFFEGKMKTFSPSTYLEKSAITSIKPLIYVPERDIIGFIKKYNIITVKSPCTVDGKTKREEIKNFVRTQRNSYKKFDSKIFNSIISSNMEGWN